MTGLLDYYPSWVAYRRWHSRTPGVQLAVRRNGDLVLDEAFGTADVSSGAPLRGDHLFRVASHSKSFAAVLTLQLVESGDLRLDDTVGTYVADVAGSPVADRTIGELLSHSGGVIRDSEDGDFWQCLRPFPDRDELLGVVASASAATLARNEHFKYSNIGFGLLGLVIVAVTGQDFANRLHTHIAAPLGLRDVGGELDPSRSADYAAGHSGVATARDREVIAHVDTRALAAATGCYATARDLTAFFSALLPGSSSLLSADSVLLQRRSQWDVKGNERRYAYGLFLDRIGDVELFGHTGGYPGHITCTHADAKDGWVVSALTNSIDGPASSLAAGLFKLLALGREATHAVCGDDAARFTGRFASSWGVLDVVRLDGRLFAVHPTLPDPSEDAVPLEVLDDRTLKIVGGSGGNSLGEKMPYEFAADGSVVSLRADSGGTMRPFTVPDEI